MLWGFETRLKLNALGALEFDVNIANKLWDNGGIWERKAIINQGCTEESNKRELNKLNSRFGEIERWFLK